MEARIVYMGTPEISAHVLRSLLEHGYNIVGLITNEDKEVGRKRILEPTPCKKVALEFGVPVACLSAAPHPLGIRIPR